MAEKIRILCVDDDAVVLRSLETLLSTEGYEVLAASNGAEGLSLLAQGGSVPVVLSGWETASGEDEEFLGDVRRLSPTSVRIGLIRGPEEASGRAVDDGRLYKFLPVPAGADVARDTVGNALERFRLVRALQGKDDEVLRSVAQEVELRDPYTRGHCDRVADMALSIAAVLGIGKDDAAPLRRGAWLHDCGKIGVPEAILNHPGKLSPEQFAVVKRHARWGAEIARDAGLPDGVADILLHHHQRFDGLGYPGGAGGREIPLAARIVAVADVFDAATVDRPYARGYDREDAIRVLGVMRGGAFDPEIVDALFGVLKG
jgi:putative nucleotidyltransferase with HDIG domain